MLCLCIRNGCSEELWNEEDEELYARRRVGSFSPAYVGGVPVAPGQRLGEAPRGVRPRRAGSPQASIAPSIVPSTAASATALPAALAALGLTVEDVEEEIRNEAIQGLRNSAALGAASAGGPDGSSTSASAPSAGKRPGFLARLSGSLRGTKHTPAPSASHAHAHAHGAASGSRAHGAPSSALRVRTPRAPSSAPGSSPPPSRRATLPRGLPSLSSVAALLPRVSDDQWDFEPHDIEGLDVTLPDKKRGKARRPAAEGHGQQQGQRPRREGRHHQGAPQHASKPKTEADKKAREAAEKEALEKRRKAMFLERPSVQSVCDETSPEAEAEGADAGAGAAARAAALERASARRRASPFAGPSAPIAVPAGAPHRLSLGGAPETPRALAPDPSAPGSLPTDTSGSLPLRASGSRGMLPPSSPASPLSARRALLASSLGAGSRAGSRASSRPRGRARAAGAPLSSSSDASLQDGLEHGEFGAALRGSPRRPINRVSESSDDSDTPGGDADSDAGMERGAWRCRKAPAGRGRPAAPGRSAKEGLRGPDAAAPPAPPAGSVSPLARARRERAMMAALRDSDDSEDSGSVTSGLAWVTHAPRGSRDDGAQGGAATKGKRAQLGTAGAGGRGETVPAADEDLNSAGAEDTKGKGRGVAGCASRLGTREGKGEGGEARGAGARARGLPTGGTPSLGRGERCRPRSVSARGRPPSGAALRSVSFFPRCVRGRFASLTFFSCSARRARQAARGARPQAGSAALAGEAGRSLRQGAREEAQQRRGEGALGRRCRPRPRRGGRRARARRFAAALALAEATERGAARARSRTDAATPAAR